jgi:hypothetical protein
LGDPAVDRHVKTECTFLYSAFLSKDEVHKVHDELSKKLDVMAEDGGFEFTYAASSILGELYGQGVIERILE